MPKYSRREKKKDKQLYHELACGTLIEPPMHVKPFRAATEAQHTYYNMIINNTITFGLGVAGTGKSFVPVSYAAEQLARGRVQKVIFTRPAVECDEDYGFLPGELKDKVEPYYQPIKDILNKTIGRGVVESQLKRGNFEFRPLAFLRGSTFEDCIIVLDEAQNTTPNQMKMFLTRIGENCKMVINGDVMQSDIKGSSGLNDALSRIRKIKGVAVFEFGIDDVVRSGMCKEIIRSYL